MNRGEFKEGDIIELMNNTGLDAEIGATAKVIGDGKYADTIKIIWLDGKAKSQRDGGYTHRVFRKLDKGEVKVKEKSAIRKFDTGATRSSNEGKYDYEGFDNPLVVERYAQYMNKHRVQEDGKLRDSDNWQKGMPLNSYMKSLKRHVHDMWKQHRGYKGQDTIEDSICAAMFNLKGYLFGLLKEKLSQVSYDNVKDMVTTHSDNGVELNYGEDKG